SRGEGDDWDPVWIKKVPTAAGGALTAVRPTPGGDDDIGLGLTFDECRLLAINATDERGGEAPLTRVRVLADGESVFDTGAISAAAFGETLALVLEPGRHTIRVQVWNKGYYTETPLSVERTVTCAAPTATPTATATPLLSPTPAGSATPTF